MDGQVEAIKYHEAENAPEEQHDDFVVACCRCTHYIFIEADAAIKFCKGMDANHQKFQFLRPWQRIQSYYAAMLGHLLM